MAVSAFPTKQFPAERFVESAGAIVFDTSTTRVCLVHCLERDEWLLSKGRRNCGESRHDAALREAREETGHACRLLPLTMPTRAPPSIETGHTPDATRTYENLTEPFMVTLRETNNGADMKIIWWYVAVVDSMEGSGAKPPTEEGFEAEYFNLDDALSRLKYHGDREVLGRAIALVRRSSLGV